MKGPSYKRTWSASKTRNFFTFFSFCRLFLNSLILIRIQPTKFNADPDQQHGCSQKLPIYLVFHRHVFSQLFFSVLFFCQTALLFLPVKILTDSTIIPDGLPAQGTYIDQFFFLLPPSVCHFSSLFTGVLMYRGFSLDQFMDQCYGNSQAWGTVTSPPFT